MRNLVLLNRGTIRPESQTYPDLSLANSVFDVVSDTVTCVLTSSESEVIEVQQIMKNGLVSVLASFPSSHPDNKILSFSHFVDSSVLVFVFENGDIITATYDSINPDCDTTAIEIVGLIDCGLLAASWSPDEETLSILTRENNLLLLSRLFEPICEKHLDPEDIKIADTKNVSVGWGKEETQFKGKGFKALEREREALKHAGLDLKEDSQLRDPTVAEAQKGTLSTFDDQSVKFSWRGDCEFFAVITKEEVLVESTLEVYFRRVIRVFTREGNLDSVSEAVDGIEHNLSWRPSGSLIASTQRFIDEEGYETLNVAFFERNGLRHGEFDTRLDPSQDSVIDIQWSSNSDVLALHLKNRVQIWSTKNYHWYLKQEFYVNDSSPSNEVSFVKFHPEKPLHLMVGTTEDGVQILNLAYKVSCGLTVSGHDIGMVAVIDGTEAKITPLGVANVPPPIAFREYDFPSSLNDIAVSLSNNVFAAVDSRQNVQVCRITVEEMKSNKEPLFMTIAKSLIVQSGELVKQVCFIGNDLIAILVDTNSASTVILFDIENEIIASYVPLDRRAVLLKSIAEFTAAVVEGIDGSVWQISDVGALQFITTFPQLCQEFEVVLSATDSGNSAHAFGISVNGKLYCGDQQLATAVTSLRVTDTLLVFTNALSCLYFVHLNNATNPESFKFLQDNNNKEDERIRQMERGSLLVSCFPSQYSVVLQAPRGNLETICPRMMVLSGVRKFIKDLNYHDALVACRKHRIDLDLLHDYNPQLFYDNAELFVKQINRVDYLDLFVSCLHDEDVTLTKYKDTLISGNEMPEIAKLSLQTTNAQDKQSTRRMIINKESQEESSKVNKICNTIIEVLSTEPYEKKFLQSRITAYACQKPPNLHGALTLIGTFDNAEEQEQAITHLCFLLDVNKLYNYALELYDVKLALNIAQKSQKDPKEYLPFLQNLHVQPQLRKQFLIDDHLKFNSKALGWLFEMGESAKEEFDEYVVEHSLYKRALTLFKYDDKRSKEILALYANYLYDQKKYIEAAISYELLGSIESAMDSYILSKRWREALTLAQSLNKEGLVDDIATRLSSALVEDHLYSQAAEIEFTFLGNVEEAVRLHCKSYNYETALLLATEQKRPELKESIIDVQLGEGFGTVAELLADCKGQINSQLKRLRELRQKKQEDPYAFYGIPNDDLDTPDNVSIAASETSTTPSFFTRYTGKTSGTAKTGASRRTAKNRKREERKKAKGRKGTIYEEEYLIKSVGRLVERLHQTQQDAIRLIEGLLRRNMKLQAYQVQNNWVELIEFIKDNIQEIHNMSEKDRERIDDNGEVYLIDEIPVPSIQDFPKFDILDY